MNSRLPVWENVALPEEDSVHRFAVSTNPPSKSSKKSVLPSVVTRRFP